MNLDESIPFLSIKYISSNVTSFQLDEILRLEKERPVCKLWTPVQRVFLWNPWLIPEHVEQITDDEDPSA